MLANLLRRILTPAEIEWRTFRWKIGLVAFGCVCVFYAERHVLVTVSASVEDRIFWRTGDQPDKGDYATFMFSHPLAGEKPVRLTKRLVCWEGDLLTIDGRDHCCRSLVVATGGLAGMVQRFSDEIDVHEPKLTLEGLRLVHAFSTAAEVGS